MDKQRAPKFKPQVTVKRSINDMTFNNTKMRLAFKANQQRMPLCCLAALDLNIPIYHAIQIDPHLLIRQAI